MLLSLALLAISQFSVRAFFCNTKSQFECDCAQCWDTVASVETLDWITVSLSDCPHSLNDTVLRRKLAEWINQECGAVLDCRLLSPVKADEIVVGHFVCGEDGHELRLAAVRNSSLGLTQENVLPAHLLGLVLQSREHLLSFLLHSELYSVTVHRRLKGSTVSDEIFSASFIIISLLFTLFFFFMALLVYFSQIHINWRRIVKGKWDRKEYRRVPQIQSRDVQMTSSLSV